MLIKQKCIHQETTFSNRVHFSLQLVGANAEADLIIIKLLREWEAYGYLQWSYFRHVICGAVSKQPLFDWLNSSETCFLKTPKIIQGCIAFTGIERPDQPFHKCSTSILPNWELFLTKLIAWLCSSRMKSLVVSSSFGWAELVRSICGQADPAGQIRQMVTAASLRQSTALSFP